MARRARTRADFVNPGVVPESALGLSVFDATLTRRLENLEALRAAVLIPLDATLTRRLENLEASRAAALIPLEATTTRRLEAREASRPVPRPLAAATT